MPAYRDLVRPLETPWRDRLDALARSNGFVDSHSTSALAARVAALSAIYNDRVANGDMRSAAADLLDARLVFSFARDVPKAAAAVREWVGCGRVNLTEERPLELLDIGAGLGAMTCGVARALEAAGKRGEIRATWIDSDARALSLGRKIVSGANESANVKINVVRADARDASAAKTAGTFDLIVVGQAISEMARDVDETARVAAHAKWVIELGERLAPTGAIVLVEPALRDRTRHLHAIRDAILSARVPGESDAAGRLGVFAPCLHSASCPALRTATDWCHEDLDVDLPQWLEPVARAAGLRWQGLTFSYLVLVRDGTSLADVVGPSHLRVTSGPLVTKGKRELLLCGEYEDGAGWGRARRLDRDATESNAAWDDLARGDLTHIDPRPAKGGRIAVSATVERALVDAGHERRD